MVVDVNYVVESDVTVINIQWRQLAPSEMAISRQLHASDANRGYCWQGTKQAKQGVDSKGQNNKKKSKIIGRK